MWHSPIYQGILKEVGHFKSDLVIKATHQQQPKGLWIQIKRINRSGYRHSGTL
ncbi:MAG: hypothetical protein ACI9LX_003788 [Paraglaciecola sp.]|jgi:hypothetical protein